VLCDFDFAGEGARRPRQRGIGTRSLRSEWTRRLA
jgi:hypothetical protein